MTVCIYVTEIKEKQIFERIKVANMSTFECVYKFAVPVVGCLTVAAGILARSEGVSKGTGTNQRFVKNALKNAELPPDSFKYLFFFYFCHIYANRHSNHNLIIEAFCFFKFFHHNIARFFCT